MTWREDFRLRREMAVKVLIARGVLRSLSAIRAMQKVPREEFLPEEIRDKAYIDTPLPIGFGQTVSALHMVAIMVEELELDVGQKVLEVGTGTGYHGAVLAEMISQCNSEKHGHVYTIEIIPELAKFARGNLERTGYGDRVTVICRDGSQGNPDFAPYDRILVTASAPRIPKPLIDQLRVSGLLVIPVGDLYFFSQELLKIRKESEIKTATKRLGGVVFVPLTGRYGWTI